MKVAAVVILYNPTQEVLNNISTYRNSVDYVICVDNSQTTTFSSYCKDYIYIPLFGNKGIAVALNIGIKYAEKLGCEWVLTMDQDSYFANDIVGIYKQYILKGNTKVKMYCPTYIYSRSKNTVLNDRYIKYAMQSAALIDISCFRQVGYFVEKLFIDVVDYEFCLRLIKNKAKILQVSSAKLIHSPAHTKSVSLFGFKLEYGCDSYVRYYYQARNLLYVFKIYHEPYLLFILFVKFFKIIFLFDKKLNYLRFFKAGIKDGFANNLGKCRIV